jgi:hypothetical protein
MTSLRCQHDAQKQTNLRLTEMVLKGEVAMNSRLLYSLGAMALLAGLLFAPAASAQVPLPEESTWHLTEPTEVGGTILQPGTYLITAVARPSDRNMVRVTSPDRKELFATVLTVPRYLAPGDERSTTMFVYYPAVEGQPRVLRTWFPSDPMSDGGHDIVYSEKRARELARLADTRVVTYPDTVTAADFETADLYVWTPEARRETYVVPAPQTSAAPAPVVMETRTELPRTASNTPMLALLGLLAIAGAVVIRIVR